MEAEDIRILKAKCNKLIEKALFLKEEIERKDLEIKELERQKNRWKWQSLKIQK